MKTVIEMKWLDKLKEYAPDIAAAVVSGGATLPQLALKAITDATGKPVGSETELAQLITAAAPEEMLKVTQANNAFKIRMRELDVELQSAELSDKQNARENHKHSKMPAAITIMMTLIVGVLIWCLFTSAVPGANMEILYVLIGQASALWGASITYWVGTTRSSAEKDRRKLSFS